MLLEANGISQKYGDKVAVNQLSLSVQKGSLTALLGPNGAGKSTTMKMLIGLTKPTSGTVQYEQGTKIGVVFQNSVLDNELTVRENLESRANLYKGVNKARIAILITNLGLSGFANQRYGTLSGGQKRRVDIARALLNQPDILFLDEPTTALDIQTRMAIWHLLHQLQEQEGLTIVLTTHYLDEADHADKVYIVDHGQLIAKGSAEQIKKEHAKSRLLISVAPEQREHLIGTLDSAGYAYQAEGNEHLVILGLGSQATIELLSKVSAIIRDFEYRLGTMDDAFVALTGKEMR